jgi:hypothetical protein
MEGKMKKALALATFFFVAATGTACARGATTISLNDFCDVLTITPNAVLKTALVATDDPNCENLIGAGFIGKIKVLGKSAVIGMHNPAGAAEQFIFRIDYPFGTGGSWVLYGTQDGVNLTAFAGDTYTVNGTPARGSKPVLSTAGR